MLDIGVIIPELTKYGGAERFLIECVTRWQHRHAITIYASRFAEAMLAEHGVSDRVRLRRISPGFDGPHAMLLDGALLPKIWEREVGRHDVYNAHLWPTHLVDAHPMVWFPHEPLRAIGDLRCDQPPAGGAPDGSGAVHVYPKHEYYPAAPELVREATLDVLARFDRLGAPDRIVANSRYTAGYLSEVYRTRVRDVVYPGVSLDDFMYPFPEEDLVLAVGQLWPHKRVSLAIEAVRLVEGVQLYVVGSGPEEAALRRMARGLGVADRVFFLSGLSNDEVRALYARCMAVVFTPIREPFGIVALEAMAAGRPLVAVDEGGYTEAVDGSCAFLVPPQPTAIAEKLRFIRDNREAARAMGAAGRRRAARYTWDRTAERLLAIVEKTHGDWDRRRSRGARATGSGRTLFGAHYYCWYGPGMGASHWNDTPATGRVTDAPLAGYYASAQGTTIEQHLRVLETAGLDFLVLNLHLEAGGPSGLELAAIRNVFAVAGRMRSRLQFAIQICPYDPGGEAMVRLAGYVHDEFAGRDSYLRLAGKPALFVFWTGALDGRRSWLAPVIEATAPFTRVACSLRPYPQRYEQRRTLGLFDGFCLFSPLEMAGPERRREAWKDAYDNRDAGAAGLGIVTVSPGYDDSHLEDPRRKHNPFRSVPRDDGRTYAEMIDFALALKPPPHLVLVSTFNEFHENTHIEPSEAHGDRYLAMTREMVGSARRIRRRAPGGRR